MRSGDFGVELVAIRDGELLETETGHVLARPGTVYAIRLRNYGPLRCVAEVRVDGQTVTERGLVVDAYGTFTLERPVESRDAGRFTVIAEGDERVFGPDGGRDNAALGAIEVRFRRELPRSYRYPDMPEGLTVPRPANPSTPTIPTPPGRPMAPPEWAPPGVPRFHAMSTRRPDIRASAAPGTAVPDILYEHSELFERAAGTGLTGHSAQEFKPVAIGPLEQQATVLRLRLVIGTDEAFAEPRPLADEERAPARPPARP